VPESDDEERDEQAPNASAVMQTIVMPKVRFIMTSRNCFFQYNANSRKLVEKYHQEVRIDKRFFVLYND